MRWVVVIVVAVLMGCFSGGDKGSSPWGTVVASTVVVPTMGGAFDARYEGTASTALKEKSGLIHRPTRVADGKLSTAWCEGSAGDGIGQWVEILADCRETETITFTGVSVVPGYASKEHTFRKNNRVAEARLTLSVMGETKWVGRVKFLDAMMAQMVEMGKFECPASGRVKVRLEILAVHPGSKYRDTCLSELALYRLGLGDPAGGEVGGALWYGFLRIFRSFF